MDEMIYREAIKARDASFDGAFYYGVRSTKIYCRPSCPSRQPNFANVLFFALPEAAKQSGFRSCLRCRPDAVEPRDPQAELVQRICRLLSEDVESKISLSVLSARVGLSQFHLQRVFRRVLGITPQQYSEALRAEKFKQHIKGGRGVTDAMYEAGYSSSSRLYEKASARLGMTPATYARGGMGMSIYFTIAACPLGRLLVAATTRGICAVTLGAADEELEAQLRAEYPRGAIVRDDAQLRAWVDAILAHLSGRQTHLDLPLDLQATAFQIRVWQELRRIPYGQTASYSEVARRIGQPSATRAVARACAMNPVALVTPCHRVVRENGDLGGYRWGVERKQALLVQEQQQSGRETAQDVCTPGKQKITASAS